MSELEVNGRVTQTGDLVDVTIAQDLTPGSPTIKFMVGQSTSPAADEIAAPKGSIYVSIAGGSIWFKEGEPSNQWYNFNIND